MCILSIINYVAAQFKAWVCCHSLGGIEGSILTEGVDVSLVWVLCVVRDVCVGLSLTQSSSIAWGVSEFDREASTIRRPCLTRHFCVMKKIINNPINTFFFFLFSLVPSSAYSCRCRGLLLRLITRKDKHTRQESSGRVNSPTQRPLPDIIQKSQQTDIYVPLPGRDSNPQFQQGRGRRLTP